MAKRKEKKEKVKELNIIPMRDDIIVSAYVAKLKSEIVIASQQPQFMPVQQILAVGPNVTHGSIGDWVYIDYSQFNVWVEHESPIKAGIGGARQKRQEFKPPIFAIPGEEDVFLKVNTREIDGYVLDYDKLPDEFKEVQTFAEWEAAKQEIENEIKANAKLMNLDQTTMEEEGLKFMDTEHVTGEA